MNNIEIISAIEFLMDTMHICLNFPWIQCQKFGRNKRGRQLSFLNLPLSTKVELSLQTGLHFPFFLSTKDFGTGLHFPFFLSTKDFGTEVSANYWPHHKNTINKPQFYWCDKTNRPFKQIHTGLEYFGSLILGRFSANESVEAPEISKS